MSKQLNGPQKAAILLMALGEETSAQIMKNLTTDEIKLLGSNMAAIQGVKKIGRASCRERV